MVLLHHAVCCTALQHPLRQACMQVQVFQAPRGRPSQLPCSPDCCVGHVVVNAGRGVDGGRLHESVVRLLWPPPSEPVEGQGLGKIDISSLRAVCMQQVLVSRVACGPQGWSPAQCRLQLPSPGFTTCNTLCASAAPAHSRACQRANNASGKRAGAKQLGSATCLRRLLPDSHRGSSKRGSCHGHNVCAGASRREGGHRAQDVGAFRQAPVVSVTCQVPNLHTMQERLIVLGAQTDKCRAPRALHITHTRNCLGGTVLKLNINCSPVPPVAARWHCWWHQRWLPSPGSHHPTCMHR